MSSLQEFGTQAVRDTLGRRTDVDACMELAGRVDRLLAQAATHLSRGDATLACGMGCNFCCHLRVMVLPHEAIALFRYLNSRMPQAVADRVRAKLREYARTANPAVPGAAPRACAFLVEGECSAYEVRPAACAAYHSLSRERCEQSFLDPSLPSAAVALEALQVVALALEEGVSTAVRAEGLSNVPLELHTAVAALLRSPALIARWRAGRQLVNSAANLLEPK